VWLYVEPRLMRPAETAVEAMARAWRKLSDNQTINTSMSYEQQHGFVLDELGRKSTERGYGYEHFRRNVAHRTHSN
jgi:hypothetical protein